MILSLASFAATFLFMGVPPALPPEGGGKSAPIEENVRKDDATPAEDDSKQSRLPIQIHAPEYKPPVVEQPRKPRPPRDPGDE